MLVISIICSVLTLIPLFLVLFGVYNYFCGFNTTTPGYKEDKRNILCVTLFGAALFLFCDSLIFFICKAIEYFFFG